jgi:glutamyl-tRNA synthetase
VDPQMLEQSNLMRILIWAADEGRIHKLEQLVEPSMEFLWTQPRDRIASAMEPDRIRRILEPVVNLLNGDPLDRNQLNAALRRLAAENGTKFADVMKLMRSSLTGLKEGPSVAEIIDILGPVTCIRRLNTSLSLLQ